MAGRTFTQEQLAVIAHDNGHAIVSAVPGSGKTTVLVGRLRRMTRQQSPRRNLTVMFNKDAQRAFERRLQLAVGEANAKQHEVKTFHSVGFALDKKLVRMGLVPPAKLNTSGASRAGFLRRALNAAWKSAYGSDAYPDKEQASGFAQFVTFVKSDILPRDVMFDEMGYNALCRPYIAAYDAFEQERQDRRILFYDDLIHRPVMKALENAAARAAMVWPCDDIQVDEFQDINGISFELVKMLCAEGTSVMAVGDPSQAIYAFRGSKVSYITQEFAKHFNPCTRYPLSRTFRFGHALALAANHLITHNVERDDILAIADPGNPETTIEVMPGSAVKTGDQAPVVDLLEPFHQAGKLRRAMLLVRNFAHAIPHELELAEAGIPYFVYGREPLIFVPEVASLVCALSLASGIWIVEPEDRHLLYRAIVTIPTLYLGNPVVDALVDKMDQAAEDGTPIHKALADAADEVRRTQAGNAARNIAERADVVRLLESGGVATQTPEALLDIYLRMTSAREAIRRQAINEDDAKESLRIIDAVVDLSRKHQTIAEFLDYLGPLAAMKEEESPAHDHLKITSIHRAKGLEADTVIVAGMSEGVFPASNNAGVLEEERRLAYVAMTRAVRRLVLFAPADEGVTESLRDPAVPWPESRVASRWIYEADPGLATAIWRAMKSSGGNTLKVRAADVGERYLAEIGRNDIKLEQNPDATPGQAGGAAPSDFPDNYRPSIGDILYHPDLGPCEVRERVRHPVYGVEPAGSGKLEFMVITADLGWKMVQKAV